MKQVLLESYGTPWDVARCADVADIGAPAADEVVFDVLAFPINPADMDAQDWGRLLSVDIASEPMGQLVNDIYIGTQPKAGSQQAGLPDHTGSVMAAGCSSAR